MPHRSSRRRAAILVTLCLSVFLIVVDNTIVNVALPTLVRDLGATTSQLQWIVDAYTLVFAGLLLAAGTMGDRLGRKGVLMGGLAWFAFMSFAASRTTSASGKRLRRDSSSRSYSSATGPGQRSWFARQACR